MFGISPKLIIALALGALVLAVGGYITYLRSANATLKSDLIQAQVQVVNLQGVVAELSETKATLLARAVQADLEVKKLRAVKTKERVRIVKEVVPSTCPEAVEWLRKELQ